MSGLPTETESQALPEGVDVETGYRMGQYRAPTPNVLAGGTIVDAQQTRQLVHEGAVLIDVYGTGDIPFDPFDGTWPLVAPRDTIPGGNWIPEIGRGYLSPKYQRYYEHYMTQLTQGDTSRAIVFYCVSDCWMAWNVARRAILDGYTKVHWYPEGTDGWIEAGGELQSVRPLTVPLED